MPGHDSVMPSAAFAADAADAEGSAAEATGGIAGGKAGAVPGAGVDPTPAVVLPAVVLPPVAAPDVTAGLEEASGRTSIFAGALSAL